jgi:hypothetical protein
MSQAEIDAMMSSAPSVVAPAAAPQPVAEATAAPAQAATAVMTVPPMASEDGPVAVIAAAAPAVAPAPAPAPAPEAAKRPGPKTIRPAAVAVATTAAAPPAQRASADGGSAVPPAVIKQITSRLANLEAASKENARLSKDVARLRQDLAATTRRLDAATARLEVLEQPASRGSRRGGPTRRSMFSPEVYLRSLLGDAADPFLH